MRLSLLGLAALCVSVVAPEPAMAQPSAVSNGATRTSPGERVDIAVLGVVVSGADLASGTAAGTTNTVSSGGAAPYFETQTRLAAAAGAELRASVRLRGRWHGEAGLSYARPTLEVRLDDDVEDAAPVTAMARLTQVVVDGALVRRLAASRARLVPFVGAGAGYLRQLDAPRTTVGTGQVYFGGGGLLMRIGGAPTDVPRVRLRADVRVVGYRGGLPLADERTVGLVAAAGVSVRIR